MAAAPKPNAVGGEPIPSPPGERVRVSGDLGGGSPAFGRRSNLALLALVLLALLLFLFKANLQIADDDAVWLQGRAPTVFDQYRHIPRLSFITLNALFGASAPAALALIFATHALNGLLLYLLARRWLAGEVAALAAAGVLLVNPITLNTLTWISCLSYVQGTTLALLALLAFWRAGEEAGGRRLAWAAGALAAYLAGLFCCHELFFLPILFPVLGWQRRELRLGAALLVLGLALAGLVNALVYQFGRYGVEAGRLLSLDFALAYASSALSTGLALALAYPLSFFVRTVGLLQFLFAEPLRWIVTAAVVLVAAWGWGRWRRGPWRLAASLVAAFVVLVTPYVIRLYLTPDTVNYHISYVLSGRVFYLAFVAVALALGGAIARLSRPLWPRRGARALLLLPLAAFLHALWLYDRADFLGLNVVHGAGSTAAPPRWNPYLHQHPAYALLPLLALVLVLLVRRPASRPRP